MSIQNKNTLFQKQKNTRPKIEDVIVDVLDGGNLKNAQEFIAYLREYKMNPQWGSANSWKVSYKGQGVCYIRLHGTADYHNVGIGSWHISPSSGFDDEYENMLSNEQIEAVWNNVKYCRNCSKCGPGKHATVLGKEFDGLCNQYVVFDNPDTVALNCAKKLVDLRRNEILGNA